MALANKLLNWTAVVLSILWTFLCGSIAIPGFLINKRFGHKVQRLWGKGILFLNGIHVHYQNLEELPKERAAILAPNHQSFFDIVIMAAMPLDFMWVAKAELNRVPIIGRSLKNMGAYMVARDRSSQDLNVMKVVEQGLLSGNSVLIFPEGTRTRTGELLPFKKGAFKLAQNTGIPLWPIAIDGAWNIAPPGKIPTRWGHKVDVRVGRPVIVEGDANLQNSMKDYRETLTELLSRTRQSHGNERTL